MSETREGKAGRRSASGFGLAEWSLRRKIALALAVPMLLAAALGGLRVNGELKSANNYLASNHQVTVLQPAVAYLSAAEQAAVVARGTNDLTDPDRLAAIAAAKKAGTDLQNARSGAELTSAQSQQLDQLLKLSEQLRDGTAYVSVGQAVSQIRQLHTDTIGLINSIINSQFVPEPKLQVLEQVLDGRVSLTMQQVQVAYNHGSGASPVDLASELGVEQAAIERLGASLGNTQPQVLALAQQNAAHFGSVSAGKHDMGDATDYAPYDKLSASLMSGISSDTATNASHARRLALLNAAITLAALLLAIALALAVSRLVLNPIRRVREGALKVANQRLPDEVARIRAGNEVTTVTPIDVTSREEIGQLARAVDELHQQAVNLASGEAKVRAQVGEMFVTLSRRSTTLINQQLGLIENLEKDEEDPQRLESLFRLDHLASRMRRTAESLMVLADAPTPPGDSAGLSVTDALQAAIAGVQDYQRVQFTTRPTERLNAAAATDVIHLLTELIDNALAYSPPTAPVIVTTSSSRAGTTVQVSDAGLGIPAEDLTAINAELHSGGEITVETARRMGLLVVSRLARRYGISVNLDHNDRNGITASVRIPATVLRDLAAGSPSAPSDQSTPSTPSPVSAPSTQSSGHFAPVSFGALSDPSVDSRPPTPAVGASASSGAETGDAADVDPISAAINAVIRLPQRQPGSSDIPGAPAASGREGGSLFQRFASSREDRAAAAAAASAGDGPAEPAPAAQDKPATPELEPVSLDQLSEQADAHSLASTESLVADGAGDGVLQGLTLPTRVPGAASNGNGAGNGLPTGLPTRPPVGSSAGSPAGPPTGPPTGQPATAPSADPEHDAGRALESTSATSAPAAAHMVLDSATPIPDTGQDESPIFRQLRSNWFSAGGGSAAWASHEVDAGWQAADRAAETPPTRVSESGLPMRRPGNRLVPGGVAPVPAATGATAAPEPAASVRDPEAIRARLAAHAAGVSRGRSAAAETLVPDTEQEAGPA